METTKEMNQQQYEDVEQLNRQENEISACKNQFSFISKKIDGAPVIFQNAVNCDV